MANYGKYFQSTFDPPDGGSFAFKPRYRLEIHKKNYDGATQSITGGEAMVKQTWQTDQAKPAIKGCSLTISLVNKNQSLPLSTFLSTDDDEYKVRLYWIEKVILTTVDRLLFEGFIVQDDCNEIMVDYTHTIELTATDNLGLLKQVALNEAPASFEYFNGGTTILMASSPHLLRIGIGLGRQVEQGDRIEIIGTAIAGIYNIVSFVENGLYLDITTVEPIATLAPTSTTINILRSNLLEKITLNSILKRCLSATGLELDTNIYTKLKEVNHLNSKSLFAQTLIEPETFLKNDTDFEDCYTILEKILRGDNENAMFTLFQDKGKWNIVRWDELREYSNLIEGFSYDKDFNYLGLITLPANITAGIGEDSRAETGLSRQFFRPYVFTKEQFDYKNPPHLLRNANLQILGNLLRDYTNNLSGADFRKIKEYKMPWWYVVPPNTVEDYYIRVVYDQYDNEVERYLVLTDNEIKSYRIEASEGDILELSFNVKMDQQWVNDITFDYIIEITDGATTKRLRNYLPIAGDPGVKPYWGDGGGYRFRSTAVHEDNNVTITSPPIPFDSLLYVYLMPFIVPPQITTAAETYYNDIRFTYISFINKSTKIIGQTHKSEQVASIKQRNEKPIYADDSPRNSIAGTLYLDRKIGVLQERTTRWERNNLAATPISCNLYHFVVFGPDSAPWTVTGTACDGTPINLTGTKLGGPPSPQCARPGSLTLTGSVGLAFFTADCATYTPTVTAFKLGAISTMDNLQWRNTARTKLDGLFVGLLHDNGHYHVSMSSVFKYSYYPELNFVFGKLEINYKKNMFSCTMWEMYKDGEPDIVSNYEFKYLYETK